MPDELTAPERDRLYTAAQSEDWLESLYLAGMRDALSDPARARELTGVAPKRPFSLATVCIDCGSIAYEMYWTIDSEPVCGVCVAKRQQPEVSGHSWMNHEFLTLNGYSPGPPRSLEQRIVGASHAEGAE